MVPQLGHLLADLGDDVVNLLLNLLESELTTITALPDFFLALLSLPVHLPFTCVICTDCALGLTALDTMGIHVSKCTDCDLVLGLPALDVDAIGLCVIRHSTISQNLCCHSKILKVDH